MSGVVLLYVTVSGLEEAETLGRILLEKRLCACVNIFPEMRSFYWWEGKIESSREAVLIVKTTQRLAEPAREEIVRHHSYSCPCVLIIPVSGGHGPFLEWIFTETARPE
ncbi:divalent-cation tolerance protein CutA [Thermosulfurimonas sp. F29]|uniref:divalent-cation tolerance protein CutA n=1 Tax=Thermosulfurimonas sp. F29 TaxID=2867247 RepID=UPI001C83F03C|nr:divalent-cation tolerance protein CutA [Thermosulfurimonas sp. F29]MBX6422484.1 divalent-cation tolerance protein CutA [Thermosulfurimonas sp. F29]